MPEFKYQIANKTYVQRPLVLGQIRQLLGILKDIDLPKEADPVSIAVALGDKLP